MPAVPELPTITWHELTTEQLRRAYALILVRLIWPTITSDDGQQIARWITTGQEPTNG